MNHNNPKEVLKKLEHVFISKKANYIDCISCNCCIGENVFKVYKYWPPEAKATYPSFSNKVNPTKATHFEGGEPEMGNPPSLVNIEPT